jgi:hypothetical protein
MAVRQVDVTFVGMDKVIAMLELAPKETIKAVRQVIEEVSFEVLARSNDYVPVDTGALKTSGNIIRPTETKSGVEGGVGYGGAASKYAVYVHENLNANHPNGGQAKFLERATSEVEPFISTYFAERMPKILKV